MVGQRKMQLNYIDRTNLKNIFSKPTGQKKKAEIVYNNP